MFSKKLTHLILLIMHFKKINMAVEVCYSNKQPEARNAVIKIHNRNVLTKRV